jgi:phosphate transport system substrate-binding protein
MKQMKKQFLPIAALFVAAALFLSAEPADPAAAALWDELEAAEASAQSEIVITVRGTIKFTPYTFTNAFKGKTITLTGGDTPAELQLEGRGSLFTVKEGVTLILEKNLTLRGSNGNNRSLVAINKGTLEMKDGSAILDNTAHSGGAVNVASGTFIMDGGKISGNSAYYGGGIHSSGSNVTIQGGTISHNRADAGGGIYLNDGNNNFIMTGGIISANEAGYRGGGMAAYDGYGSFTKDGGIIYGNDSGENSNRAKYGSAVSAKALSPGGEINREQTIGEQEVFEISRESVNEFFDLNPYIPFSSGTKAALLNGSSTLQLRDHLPVLNGATALYPVYAAFAQAVYPEKDYSDYESGRYWSSAERLRIAQEQPVLCDTTEEAYEQLIDGIADIIFCYEPSAKQLKAAAAKGLSFNMTAIGKDAFVFFVNTWNPVSGLGLNDIRDIYAGRAVNWNRYGGPDATILAYQRRENSGSQTALRTVMAGDKLMETRSVKVETMFGMIDVIANYANTSDSLGYSFLFFTREMVSNSRIKLLAIDGISPTLETIRNGTYPLTKTFYAITLSSNNNENVRRFIQWMQGEQGRYLVEQTGYAAP